MGSCNTFSYYGPTKNPWSYDKVLVAGGSSGGSAASVASRMCFASLGSDTGGSVRMPASYCGLVGLRGTYGKASRYGLISYVSSLDCPGVVTISVNDAAIMFDVIAGDDNVTSMVSFRTPSHMRVT